MSPLTLGKTLSSVSSLPSFFILPGLTPSMVAGTSFSLSQWVLITEGNSQHIVNTQKIYVEWLKE